MRALRGLLALALALAMGGVAPAAGVQTVVELGAVADLAPGAADSLAVVVPNRNVNASLVLETLGSIDAAVHVLLQAFPGVRVHVVFVDDASADRDGLAPVLAYARRRRPAYKVVLNREQLERGVTRNLGVAATDADVVCFLDSDDLYRPDHLAVAYRALAQMPDIDVVKTGVILDDEIHPEWHKRVEHSLLQNTCLRRACHDRAGGFPESLIFDGGGEDDAYFKVLREACNPEVARITKRTVHYKGYPGNAYRRQLPKFLVAPGQFDGPAEPLNPEQLRANTAFVDEHRARLAAGQPDPFWAPVSARGLTGATVAGLINATLAFGELLFERSDLAAAVYPLAQVTRFAPTRLSAWLRVGQIRNQNGEPAAALGAWAAGLVHGAAGAAPDEVTQVADRILRVSAKHYPSKAPADPAVVDAVARTAAVLSEQGFALRADRIGRLLAAWAGPAPVDQIQTRSN